MRIKKATEQNRAEINNYLNTDAEINTFLLADILHYGFESDFQEVWISYKNGKMNGVILRYSADYLFYTRAGISDFEPVTNFLLEQSPASIHMRGELADTFLPYLSEYNKHSMTLCRLDDFTLLSEHSEAAQLAATSEALEIAEQFFKIDELTELYMYDADTLAEIIRNRINSGEGLHMYIRNGGEIAAHGNIGAMAEKSAFINAVFTLPQFRGRGYAKTIVSALCRYLLERGKTPVLSFDNPDAGRLYYKLGFKQFDRWVIFTRKKQ